MWKIVCFSAFFMACGWASVIGERTLIGGYKKIEDLQTVDAAVLRVAKEHVLLQGMVKQSCANDIQPYEGSSQLVNGVNYLLKYKISSTCNSANGATTDLTCTVTVYKPLPYKNEEPTISGRTKNPTCQ